MAGEPEIEYMAYLLRLWLVNTDTGRVWRASLESPDTGEQLGFPCLEALFAFLVEQTTGSVPAKPLPPNSGPLPQEAR